MSAKAAIAASLEHSKGAPGHGLNGIRLTLAGMPSSSRTSSRASAGLSLTPFSITYSKVMRRALLDAGIGAARVEQLGDRIFLVERHQHVAQLVGHRVQRDREVDAELGAAALDHRHHARGRERDLAPRDRQPLVVHDDLQRLRDVVVIVERLAHAHQHDVGELPVVLGRRPFAERVARQHHLADDLGGVEIAHQALRAGVAEVAGERAADLRRDAERAAILFGDVDAFDLLPVGEAQQPFARAVRRGLRARRHRAAPRRSARRARARKPLASVVIAAKSVTPR